MAVFCNISNLSAFGQSWLSCSESPVSSLKAAYFEGYLKRGGILKKKSAVPTALLCLCCLLKRTCKIVVSAHRNKTFPEVIALCGFVRSYVLIHSSSRLHSAGVCLDLLEVFKNKNKSNISLCCLQTYPWSMEGIGEPRPAA